MSSAYLPQTDGKMERANRDALQRAKDKQRAFLSTRQSSGVSAWASGAPKHLRTISPSAKLSARYIGQFTITAVGCSTVTLALPPLLRIHPTVNVAYVREYYS